MKRDCQDQRLNAYVDGELDAEEAQALFRELGADPERRAELAELENLKHLVRSAYADARPPEVRPRPRPSHLRRVAVAAMVLAAFLGGWLAHQTEWRAGLPWGPLSGLQGGLAAGQVPQGLDKVVIHVDESDPAKWRLALDTAETLASQPRAEAVQVELLTNADGIDLLRSDVSPFVERIRDLAREHPNLAFIACANGLRRLEERGVTVKLVSASHTAPSALEHVVGRLLDGWKYVKI